MQQQKWHVQASFFFYLMHTQVFMLDYPYRFYFYLVAKLRYLIKKNTYLANGLRGFYNITYQMISLTSIGNVNFLDFYRL